MFVKFEEKVSAKHKDQCSFDYSSHILTFRSPAFCLAFIYVFIIEKEIEYASN